MQKPKAGETVVHAEGIYAPVQHDWWERREGRSGEKGG